MDILEIHYSILSLAFIATSLGGGGGGGGGHWLEYVNRDSTVWSAVFYLNVLTALITELVFCALLKLLDMILPRALPDF